MKIKVTLHIDFPDSWASNRDLSSSKKIIEMLQESGVGNMGDFGDEIVDAEVISENHLTKGDT